MEPHFTEIEWYDQIKDSKELSCTARKFLYDKVKAHFRYKAVHIAVQYIEKFNINKAIQKGVYKLVQEFQRSIQKNDPKGSLAFVLMDGNYGFSFHENNMPATKDIIKGDQNCFTIACASIIAKVSRDNLIQSASDKFSHYKINKNKGYGTKEHFAAINDHGITKFHRKSYLSKIDL